MASAVRCRGAHVGCVPSRRAPEASDLPGRVWLGPRPAAVHQGWLGCGVDVLGFLGWLFYWIGVRALAARGPD
eukprot:9135126-Pyramimonas_sp.AAC.1